MAIINFKKQNDTPADDGQKLMCSIHGCGSRWSVHSDGEKPKCSKHQWQKSLDYKTPDFSEIFKSIPRHKPNVTDDVEEIF